MVNVEAEPENDQSSESKSQLPEGNFQQSWLFFLLIYIPD